MPRINPLQLLKILSVLLAPNGGIKSKDEVQRLASLMLKFSKKLVSKCIYVSILKASEPDLLVMWLAAGGWELIYNWLNDAVEAKNWPLVNELVDLLLICPIDIERLKSNRCPKLIKTLSKNQNATESVQLAAAQIVKKWLDVVNDVLTKETSSSADHIVNSANQEEGVGSDPLPDNQGQLPVYRIIRQDGKEVLTEVTVKDRLRNDDGFDSDIGVASEVRDDSKKSEVEKPVKQFESKTRKVVDNTVFKKVNKMDSYSDESSESSQSDSEMVDGASSESSTFIPSNKNDPRKDRRKDRLRQIRKDPDADDEDFILEEFEKETSPVKRRKKKIETNVVKPKLKRKPVRPKVSESSSAVVVQEKNNPDLSKLGRIPKKSDRKLINKDDDKKIKPESNEKNLQAEKVEKKSDKPTLKTKDSEKDGLKSKDRNKSPEKDVKVSNSEKTSSIVKKSSEIKKPPPLEIKRDSKKYNISVEARKVAPGEARPKTVKTFNSKFRSTGLEEELPPPPAQKSAKKTIVLPPLSLLDKKPLRRISPPKEIQPPEKKAKGESHDTKKSSAGVEKTAAIPAAKQSPVNKTKFIQESGSFMDALNASMSSAKDSKKKKARRLSSSRDSDRKESNQTGQSTPPQSPNQDDKSPPVAKPNFRFYQDTLDHTEDNKNEGTDEKKKQKEVAGDTDEDGDSNEEKRSPSPDTPEKKATREANIRNEENRLNSQGLRGVLVFAKLRKGPKKKVQWKTELTAIKLFESDESERVNVTKTFFDMKQMERIHERENFQIARKLGNDIMEEKTRWKVLIPIDLPAPLAIPGKNSNEKEIQYAREKTVLQAVYLNRRLIPDSPGEPDLEIHATTDPTIIPLEDTSGNEESVNDFTNVPWPEPHPELIPPPSEPIMVPGMVPNAPVPPPAMGTVANFMPGAGPGPMSAGPPSFPGPVPNQGVPGPMGPMGPGPNMGFPGFPGPGGPFGPPQPGPPNMGMMPPNDWMGPGPDMKGPSGPGPEMFGPGPGMGPPGMMPPEIAFGMPAPIRPSLLGPGPMNGPDKMNFPGGPPFNMNQGPNQGPPMFNAPPFQGGNSNNNNSNNNGGGVNNNMNQPNWNRGGEGGGGGERGPGGHGRGGGGGGPWRNKRDRNERRGGGNSWRNGGGGNNNRGGSKNILCNNYLKWGSCRNMNCNYKHPN